MLITVNIDNTNITDAGVCAFAFGETYHINKLKLISVVSHGTPTDVDIPLFCRLTSDTTNAVVCYGAGLYAKNSFCVGTFGTQKTQNFNTEIISHPTTITGLNFIVFQQLLDITTDVEAPTVAESVADWSEIKATVFNIVLTFFAETLPKNTFTIND